MSHEALPSATAGRALRVPILVATIVFGAGAIVLARHYQRPDPPQEPAAPGMTVGSDSVTLAADAPAWNVIKLGKPSPATPHWTDSIPARIQFDESRASRIGSPLAGRVTSIVVERGQHVKSGQALFTVSSPSLAELRNDLAKATIQRATARTNLDRVQALVDAGSLPGKELITAKQALAEAELAVSLAQQKLASLKVAGGGDTTFTVAAPRDGVIVEKTLAIGQPVDPSNGSLLAIADLSSVWVVADVFEGDAGGLAPGAQAKVVINGAEIETTVDQVSAVVDPDRHTVPVRVRLPNPDGTLRPNAYAQIALFDSTKASLSLPTSAVMSDGATSYVYLKDKAGAMRRRNIKVGTPSAGVLPVIEGIVADDQVVLQGAILLDNQIQLTN